MGRVSITRWKGEEFRCMCNKFNSIIIVYFSVKNRSGLIMIRLSRFQLYYLLLYKVCCFFAREQYFEHSPEDPLIVVIDTWKTVWFSSLRRPISAPLILNYLCLWLTGRCVSSWSIMCRFLSFICIIKRKTLDTSLSCYISNKLATNMRNIF